MATLIVSVVVQITSEMEEGETVETITTVSIIIIIALATVVTTIITVVALVATASVVTLTTKLQVIALSKIASTPLWKVRGIIAVTTTRASCTSCVRLIIKHRISLKHQL